jgi:hypothetical protein
MSACGLKFNVTGQPTKPNNYSGQQQSNQGNPKKIEDNTTVNTM